MLACPDFSEPFTIHTDARHCQLGGIVSQEGKPMAFHSRKLTDTHTYHTTTERELLSIVEMLKECRNILLEHTIGVFVDHKNLVCKHFNTERVMRCSFWKNSVPLSPAQRESTMSSLTRSAG
jgi:hypothetical protein